MVRKMGPLSKIFGMLPGMGEIKDQLNNIDEKRGRPDRGDHPLDDAGRAGQSQDHRRLPPGPDRQGLRGRGVSEVNGLVNRFFEARKMMSSHGHRQDAGHAGTARHGRRASSRPKAKKKKGGRGVSGNPAKRNAPQPGGAPAVDPAAAFGAGSSWTRRRCRRRWPSSSCRPSCAAGFGK